MPLRLTWDNSRRKAKLFATLGVGKPRGVVLLGHTDTVPWDGQAKAADPLSGHVQDGRRYGRGSRVSTCPGAACHKRPSHARTEHRQQTPIWRARTVETLGMAPARGIGKLVAARRIAHEVAGGEDTSLEYSRFCGDCRSLR